MKGSVLPLDRIRSLVQAANYKPGRPLEEARIKEQGARSKNGVLGVRHVRYQFSLSVTNFREFHEVSIFISHMSGNVALSTRVRLCIRMSESESKSLSGSMEASRLSVLPGKFKVKHLLAPCSLLFASYSSASEKKGVRIVQ